MIINIPTSLWLKLNLPRKDYFSTSQKYHKMLGFQRVWEKSFGVSVSSLFCVWGRDGQGGEKDRGDFKYSGPFPTSGREPTINTSLPLFLDFLSFLEKSSLDCFPFHLQFTPWSLRPECSWLELWKFWHFDNSIRLCYKHLKVNTFNHRSVTSPNFPHQ